MSHPSWVCGLKLVWLKISLTVSVVTPFVGVWIETLTNKRVDSYDTSHPSWVCGLKP